MDKELTEAIEDWLLDYDLKGGEGTLEENVASLKELFFYFEQEIRKDERKKRGLEDVA